MTMTMRAITQDVLGGPEVLRLATVDRPVPGIGQVLVRVAAAGVNPADAMNRQTGVFSGTPPFVLGWDLAGVVEAVGPGVTLWVPGDEVFGLLPFPRGGGAYAEFAIAPARALVRKPARLSPVEAAALPLAGLTAWQALVETADVGPGTRVLVTGAAGGVGHLAVQIAAARGAQVVGLASGPNAAFVGSLGAAEVVDYRSVEFGEALDELDVVLDVVGGDYPVKALRTLRPGGILVSTLPQSLAAVAPAAAEQGIRVAGLFVESDRLGLTALAELVDTGRLAPTVAAIHPLEEAAVAHETKHGAGKVVLTTERPQP
jgi:NADPH:quinone reductase-like Zn-dependent oxidoreductase